MAPAFLHFIANLILAGLLIRMVQYQWPDAPLSKALAVIY